MWMRGCIGTGVSCIPPLHRRVRRRGARGALAGRCCGTRPDGCVGCPVPTGAVISLQIRSGSSIAATYPSHLLSCAAGAAVLLGRAHPPPGCLGGLSPRPQASMPVPGGHQRWRKATGPASRTTRSTSRARASANACDRQHRPVRGGSSRLMRRPEQVDCPTCQETDLERPN
jgi:hypothetical protein